MGPRNKQKRKPSLKIYAEVEAKAAEKIKTFLPHQLSL